MRGERRARILSQLAGHADMGASKLCAVGAALTSMGGAGIMLMSQEIPQGSLCSSDAVSARIEELQYDLGEGPCIEAFHLDEPVQEPDLPRAASRRWVAFSGPAVDAGVGAIFAFPLRIGAIRLGVMDLYRGETGPMTDEQHADALVMADLIAQTILALQADASPGEVANELTAAADNRQVVHQATGMVAAQLDVGVATALIRLRAHAFGNGRPLDSVARDVVNRVLRFDEASSEQDGVRQA
ncbi:GAF domain-containing protein [soil metagenome]